MTTLHFWAVNITESDRFETHILVEISKIVLEIEIYPVHWGSKCNSLNYVISIHLSCVYLIQARTKFGTPINTYLCVNLRNTYEKPFYKFNYLIKANQGYIEPIGTSYGMTRTFSFLTIGSLGIWKKIFFFAIAPRCFECVASVSSFYFPIKEGIWTANRDMR